jgi:hypothetical protein
MARGRLKADAMVLIQKSYHGGGFEMRHGVSWM